MKHEILLPSNFNVMVSGCCKLASLIVAKKLITTHPELKVVEGYIQFIDHDDDEDQRPECLKMAHTWVESDGEIIDLTLEQFSELLDDYDFERIKTKEYTASEYINVTSNDIGEFVKPWFFDDHLVPNEVTQLFEKL